MSEATDTNIDAKTEEVELRVMQLEDDITVLKNKAKSLTRLSEEESRILADANTYEQKMRHAK